MKPKPLTVAAFWQRAADEMKTPKGIRFEHAEAVNALTRLLDHDAVLADLTHANIAAVKQSAGSKVTAAERWPRYLRGIWQLAYDAGLLPMGPRPDSAPVKIKIEDNRRGKKKPVLLIVLVEKYLATRDVCRSYRNDMEVTVRRFGEALGRPATTGDFSREAFGAFADWLRTYTTVANNRALSVGAHTANGYLRKLKTLWFFSADEERLCDPPPRKVKRFKTTQKVIDGWDAAQLAKLLAEVDKQPERWRVRMRSALLLAWNTGMRRGDIFSIRREQVSTTGELIHVQNKTGRVIRRQLWPETLEAIEALQNDGPTLLPRKNLRWLGIYIKECCKAAGIPQGIFKFARRGSSSEVEKSSPGQGWKWCGHTAPGLFETNYKVDRICGEVITEPPRPVLVADAKGGAA